MKHGTQRYCPVFAFCAGAVFGITPAEARASGNASEQPVKISAESSNSKAAFYLSGMWDALEKIRSGDVELMDGKTPARLILDTDNSLIRYDFQGRVAGGHGSHVVLSPEAVIEHIVGTGVIARYHPDRPPAAQDSVPPDLAMIGMISVSEWQYRFSRTAYVSDVEAKFALDSENDREVVLIARSTTSPPGQPEIQYEMTRRLWLNKTRDLTPNRMEVVVDAPAVPYRLESKNSTDWAMFGGVWVPVKTLMSSTETIKAEPPQSESRSITLNWKSVNEPIAPELFEPTGFGAKDGEIVMDYRHEPPVQEMVIGETKTVVVPVTVESQPTRWFIIVFNIVAIFAITVALTYRYFRKRPQRT